MIRSRWHLIAGGWTDRMLSGSTESGALQQIRRGWFIARDEWEALWPEQRHLAHVIAVARDGRAGVAASYTSAAVLHDLPLYRLRPKRVHLTTPAPTRISSNQDVLRHKEELPASDVTFVDGIRCTTLARTVFDLIRTLPLEAAVAVADAAERQISLRGREWDIDATQAWRGALARRIEAAGGTRGIRQARFVAEFADGRGQLPGESVSRLHLRRLGFASPQLQVEIPGPGGSAYLVDFGLADVRCFGEFDGEGKYRQEALRAGRSLEDVLLDEKKREDWIRGRTQWRFARWGSEHITTAARLGQRLAEFDIRPPR